MPKAPSPQAISRLLKAAGFERSEMTSRASLRQTWTTGFRVRFDKDAGQVFVGWLHKRADPYTPYRLLAEQHKATALEMAGKYAEAISAAGWNAEVIHLAGPVVRVTAKEG